MLKLEMWFGVFDVNLIIGNKYKWKHELQVLVYIGVKNGWHQFELNGEIWCEVLYSDLHLMDEVLTND